MIVQRAQQAAAESARAAVVAARDSARAAADHASAAADSARAAPPPTATPGDLVSFAVSTIVTVALLSFLWVALGRPRVKRWLAERHGVQVLLLWAAMVLYTLVSCASAVADDFSLTGPRQHGLPVELFVVLWLALVIVTWRWASARGPATRGS